MNTRPLTSALLARSIVFALLGKEICMRSFRFCDIPANVVDFQNHILALMLLRYVLLASLLLNGLTMVPEVGSVYLAAVVSMTFVFDVSIIATLAWLCSMNAFASNAFAPAVTEVR